MSLVNLFILVNKFRYKKGGETRYSVDRNLASRAFTTYPIEGSNVYNRQFNNIVIQLAVI